MYRLAIAVAQAELVKFDRILNTKSLQWPKALAQVAIDVRELQLQIKFI